MAPSILKLNPDLVEYLEPSIASNGHKVVDVRAEGKRIQYQLFKEVFDSSKEVDDLPYVPYDQSAPFNPRSIRWPLAVTVGPAIAEILKKLDEKNKAMAVEHSKSWFGQELDRETVDRHYYAVINTQEYQGKPLMYPKVVQSGDRKTTIVTAVRGKELKTKEGEMRDIVRGSRVLASIEASGLWFEGLDFGMVFTVTDIVVWKPARRPRKSKSGLDPAELDVPTQNRGVEAFGFKIKTRKVERP